MYVERHVEAQSFQPFSFARKLSGVNIKYHNDSAGTCKPWTHKTNMTPNLLFVTIIKRYPGPKCSQYTDDKPVLRLQFQNCRPSMLLFSDVAIGCNRLNESNLVVLSWFGGVVGMKFSLKRFAPYLLSSGADF